MRRALVIEQISRAISLFRVDAARWVRPQQVGEVESLLWPTVLKLLWKYPPLRAMAWFRFGAAAHGLGVPGVPGWAQRRLLRLYGLQLEVGAIVGGGLYISHPVGCVLFGESIGTNVTVISLVTFGTRDDGRFPQIADGTFFGAGSRVLGGVTVGEGARVGANAVVIHDVEPGTTVVGAPARVVRARL